MEVDMVSIERVMEYVRLPSETEVQARAYDAPYAREALTSVASPPNCAIFAAGAQLRYSISGPWVLNDLHLQIQAGTRAALVGRTGCGKSSFLSAVVRLYPTSGGCVRVHGADIVKTPLLALRKTVRVLLQDPIFFTGTIRSNLLSRPPPASALSLQQPHPSTASASASTTAATTEDESLWQALAQAGLEARVRAMPDGLGTRVEEAGQNFSQGERQLLCLARLLVQEQPDWRDDACSKMLGPRIVLCDEPTSSCDLDTDQHIHGTLLHGLPADWTLVVVCHRLHRIREFDRVFVFDAGRVAEEGSPVDLLPDRGSRGGSSEEPYGLLVQMCRQQGVL